MDKYLYYPGCSMEGSAKAYHESLMAVCGPLGLNLEEIADWNCCGATEYLGVSLTPAYALIARNLALAADQSNGNCTVVAPCSACYLNLAKCDYYMQERPELGVNVNEALAAGGLHYDAGSLFIRHFLDVLVNDIGLDKLKSKVVRPLKGLRVAPYLGCMVPRPDYDHRWSNPEYPTELDRVLKALGAEVIDFPLKTHCCGGHMTQIGPETAYKLIHRLVSSADQYKADVMATLCPMCQMNVDAYQGEMNRHYHSDIQMPIVFFTQLVGLAFGLEPKALGFGREFVSTKHMLNRLGMPVPELAEATPAPTLRARKKQEGLPMPRMSGGAPGEEEVPHE
jgi:heterodisulfide reductase subunit B